ncbi:MAG: hypothetical protein ABH811_02130 [archaeon]
MVVAITLFIVAVSIIGIWIIIEIKRTKHKLFAIFLIALILFMYLSFSIVFKGQDINWKSASGIMEASNLYFSWLGSAFGNVKSITGYAAGMDWNSNETIEEEKRFFNFAEK